MLRAAIGSSGIIHNGLPIRSMQLIADIRGVCIRCTTTAVPISVRDISEYRETKAWRIDGVKSQLSSRSVTFGHITSRQNGINTQNLNTNLIVELMIPLNTPLEIRLENYIEPAPETYADVPAKEVKEAKLPRRKKAVNSFINKRNLDLDGE